MGEQNKTVQAAAAMCLAKVVEEGGRGSGAVPFQRLWPRICKMLGSQSFLAKGSMLSVISSLAKVGAISSQNMPAVLQNVCDCLENTDWAARKAAADTLNLIACHSSHLGANGTSQILSSLEACRFDKVKPVRDSVMESLQLWEKILGQKEDGTTEEVKDAKVAELGDAQEELDSKLSNLSVQRLESLKDSSTDSSPTCSESHIKGKGTNLPEDAAILLKKKAPSLLDKEINAEFFQKLEARSSGIYDNTAERTVGTHGRKQNLDASFRDRLVERFRSRDSKLRASGIDYKDEFCQKDSYGVRESNRTDALVENSFVNNKGNWLGIQRQLSKLERQQTNLMKMLQDFMGGSHDSLITLEQRVCGLERVVEEIAQDLSLSSGRRG
ncbi:hypothetical protein HPP92_008520 [Vanilla planifolia]|uniref:TORTIFOLIA1/SINE1-2 N-terminal domain-containing protein n=1 Tax=Vanilla planifolia TaxID=51239 RepID=A0A835V5M6_VANPL|nr:hypothetical protein HPP92_008709 [Vanilla planifolia]KAG0486425.1 hypothetical protein HPP92_008520 [Vanilla planifolia]